MSLADINTQRTIYVHLAEKNQISLKQLELLFGQKNYKKTLSGNYMQKMLNGLKNGYENDV